MKRLPPLLSLSAAAFFAAACSGPAPTGPNVDAEHPAAPQTVLTADEQGLLHADLVIDAVNDLQTIGLSVEIENAEVLSWTRNDALLTSAGGQVLPLTSRVRDENPQDDLRTFQMVVGTTAPVSSDGEMTLASFVLRPTGGAVRLHVLTDGDNRGLLDADGSRLSVTTHIANSEEG